MRLMVYQNHDERWLANGGFGRLDFVCILRFPI